MGGTWLPNDTKSLRVNAPCPRRIDSGYEAAGLASGLWKREYVRCIFVSSAARPTAGAAAIRARSLFRFFFRC